MPFVNTLESWDVTNKYRLNLKSNINRFRITKLIFYQIICRESTFPIKMYIILTLLWLLWVVKNWFYSCLSGLLHGIRSYTIILFNAVKQAWRLYLNVTNHDMVTQDPIMKSPQNNPEHNRVPWRIHNIYHQVCSPRKQTQWYFNRNK